MKESPSYKDANTKKTIQAIISIAYQGYSHDQAAQPFTKYVKNVAIKFGVNPRHAIEAWEIDQNLYPAGYKWSHYINAEWAQEAGYGIAPKEKP